MTYAGWSSCEPPSHEPDPDVDARAARRARSLGEPQAVPGGVRGPGPGPLDRAGARGLRGAGRLVQPAVSDPNRATAGNAPADDAVAAQPPALSPLPLLVRTIPASNAKRRGQLSGLAGAAPSAGARDRRPRGAGR